MLPTAPPKIDPLYIKHKHFRLLQVWKAPAECDQWPECVISQRSVIPGTFSRFTGKNRRDGGDKADESAVMAVMAAHRWTSETAAGDSTFVDRLGVWGQGSEATSTGDSEMNEWSGGAQTWALQTQLRKERSNLSQTAVWNYWAVCCKDEGKPVFPSLKDNLWCTPIAQKATCITNNINSLVFS